MSHICSAVWHDMFPADGCKYARKSTVQLVAACAAALIVEGVPISHDRIAQLTGLNRQTVQHCVNHLVKEGVLGKTGKSTYEWKSMLKFQTPQVEDGSVPPLQLRTRRPLKV